MQVIERSLGSLRGLIPNSRLKQRREERQREKGLVIPGCHVNLGLDLELKEEELEGVQGLGHPPGVMSRAGRPEHGWDVFPPMKM